MSGNAITPTDSTVQTLNFEEYQIKGFTYTYDYNIIDLIGKLPPLDEWKIDEEFSVQYPENVNLSAAMDYIAKMYVEPFFPRYTKGYSSIWNKSETQTMEWHNDLVEGCKVFFLYYLTDVTEGGEICFRVNGKETGYVQPKKHLLVMGSQELYVEHKANYTPQTRIVSNYGFDY